MGGGGERTLLKCQFLIFVERKSRGSRLKEFYEETARSVAGSRIDILSRDGLPPLRRAAPFRSKKTRRRAAVVGNRCFQCRSHRTA